MLIVWPIPYSLRIRKNSSSCTGNNYNINAVASYCASSADCTRSSTQNTDNNTRDQPKSHIRPYPDIINHNLDVGVVGRSSTSPEITSSLSGIMKHSQQHQPQYASVDKKNSKKQKQNPNDQQLIGIVKHKDPHQTSNQYQNQMSQEQPEVTYQKIHPSKYPTRPKTDTNPSIVKATAPKVDIIKTTYPDLWIVIWFIQINVLIDMEMFKCVICNVRVRKKNNLFCPVLL